jgi:hypothetical protein
MLVQVCKKVIACSDLTLYKILIEKVAHESFRVVNFDGVHGCIFFPAVCNVYSPGLLQ